MIRDSMIRDSHDTVLPIKEALVTNVRELRVYRQAFDVSLAVHKATLEFPKIEQFALGDQMRRASKSICANLAEGFAKQAHSKPEFARFISMAIGSANEMIVWCEYAQALGYITNEKFSEWADSFDHIAKMLQKLRK